MKFDVIYSALYYDNCHPFNEIAKDVDTVSEPEELKQTNSALVIWGGSDINPEYYRHPMHRTTHPGGLRDKREWGLLQQAIDKGISIIGVCRGGQMLTAAAGGYLIQDVENHVGHHDVTTQDGKEFEVNSIHHQMMVPGDAEHELVAWSSKPLSVGRDGKPYYSYRDNQDFLPPENWKEPEFIFYPKIRGYAIQWHPEGMNLKSQATQYILNYIERKEHELNGKRTFPVCSC